MKREKPCLHSMHREHTNTFPLRSGLICTFILCSNFINKFGYRQLEACIRLSEALARLRLSAQVNEEDATEAVELFRIASVGHSTGNKDISNPSVLSSSSSSSSSASDTSDDLLQFGPSVSALRNTENEILNYIRVGAEVPLDMVYLLTFYFYFFFFLFYFFFLFSLLYSNIYILGY
jgi:hypothetical protein